MQHIPTSVSYTHLVVDGGNQEPISVPVDPVLPDPLVENPEPIRPEIQPNAPPDPIEIPVTWDTDGVDVFTGTGVERFQQEVQSANDMLNTLNTTQEGFHRPHREWIYCRMQQFRI